MVARGDAMIHLPPHLCRHDGEMLIICSYRSAGGAGQSAYICPICGSFIVWIQGEKLEFALSTDEQLKAAGRWIEYIEKGAESLAQKLSE